MIIRSKIGMDHWNLSTIGCHIMGSNVSHYILAIMFLVIQVWGAEVEEDLIIQGLEKRSRRRDTQQKGNTSAQTKTHWNVPIQLNVVSSWREKMESVIWKQSSTHQTGWIILMVAVRILTRWNVPIHLKECCRLLIKLDAVSWRRKMQLVRWTTYEETMGAWSIAQQYPKPSYIRETISYRFTMLEVLYHKGISTCSA